MLIHQIDVRRFRPLKHVTISCQNLTALVGRNGTGKSSLLLALELFYDQSAKVGPQDYYAEETSCPIEIAVTFTDLTGEQTRLFGSYVDQQRLTVEKVFHEPGKPGLYYGKNLQYPGFANIRNASSKSSGNNAYKQLLASGNPQYASLGKATSHDRVIEELEAWEAGHPEECELERDDGKFFGFSGVGPGNLARHTKFIRIPAVRDALEDAIEKRGSCVTEIMDTLVRDRLATRPEIATFREEVSKNYGAVFRPSSCKELKALQTELTETMRQYAPNAAIALDWTGLENYEPPMPTAEVRVAEDGFEAAIERAGHGVQRAFIMTMLQHLEGARDASSRKADGVDSTEALEGDGYQGSPTLILAIEEPELYQHPGRQRHMATVFRRLAEGATQGMSGMTQIIYTTHGPLFVRMGPCRRYQVVKKADGKR